ncbi:MAG: glycosyltransferase family 87 protein [Steroidobacteraceae bacterium]
MLDLALVSRACKVLLLAGLVSLLFLRGVIPAVTAITDDFPEYFTSAKSVRDGYDAVQLYDGAWFREQTHRYEVGHAQNPGQFTPYPPPTALLLTPLTDFKPLTALRIVTALNLVCLICSMLLLSRIFAWRLMDSALFILLSGCGLLSGLRFGHPYILISTFCLLGYYLYLKRMPLLAGLCLGVFVPIKYYPLIVLAGFLLHRQWRVLLGGGIAMAAVALVSVGVLGWKVHQIFLFDVLLNHLTGHLIPGPRFTAVFQSFDTLFERLFILDPARNPHPWLSAPQAATIAIVITKGLLVLAAVAALIHLLRGRSVRAIEPTIGILAVLVLLIAPGSGTYAFVLLWLPVALLIDYFLSARARVPAYLILSTYVLIGFIPYGHAYPFEGHGGLTVLAFPRLFLLLAMFVVCIYAVGFPGPSRQRAARRRIHPEMQNA